EQDYYICSSESSPSGKPLWANVDNEGRISGGPEKKTVWSLHYLDKEKGICYFGHPESGGFGGVHPKERDIRRMEEPQHWVMKKADDGYIKELFAHVDKEFGRVRAFLFIAEGSLLNLAQVSVSATRHSWVFKPVNEK
ncbi:hypothetical protein AZE42_12904, partial [Rhizopogon vesiculosus]